MKVIAHERATESITKMSADCVARMGNRSGRKVIAKYEDAKKLLARQPWLGRLEPLLADRAKAYRSLVIHKHCKVVYFVDEEADTLVIADVWDTRREPKNLTQNL